jgi:hypothetical protein
VTQAVVHKPTGFAQYTTLSSAIALSATPTTGIVLPDNACRALIQPEAQAIRWRDDGTAPTAAIGLMIPVGIVLEYEGDLALFKMIEMVAGAKVNVSYYRI